MTPKPTHTTWRALARRAAGAAMVDIGHRRSARSRDTREAILEAACVVFSENGYEATSLEAIAAAGGVTKGTLYYHFSSKESIYAAVLTQYIGEATEKAEAAAATATTPQEALSAVVDLAIDDTLNPAKRYIHYQEMVKVDLTLREVIREVQRQYEITVAEVIASVQRETGDRNDPRLLAMMTIGAIGRTSRWYDHEGPVPPEAFAQLLRSFVLHGLLSPGVAIAEQ